ncbi:MAG TPA: acetylornithine deacetylase [Bryobacteraceae bacterium]|nr:acetylornithine deacetylase [Bryobacteraceae bacterium]
MRPEVRSLLDLVAIPSVSPLCNQPVIDYALRQLDPAVWAIDVYSYRDPNGITKSNLVAISGAKRRAVELALVCHTDTVPYDPAWPEAVHPKVRGGKLYGRGSCDVKGFLACVLAAVSQVGVARLSKPLALILTADEEIGCVGAKFLARQKPVRSRYTIIGEPTGMHPVRSGKGYALAEIVVRGKEAHSAFPGEGRSAIYDAARIVTRLEGVGKKLRSRKNRDFDPPCTTLNVGLIEGGTAKNIVPGECRITAEWRPIPGQDPEWAAELIREALAGFDARLEVKRMDAAFEPAPGDDLATLLESLTRKKRATVAFGTEAAHLRSLTQEAVVFGPGEMTTAHKTGEFVPLKQLSECVECLTAVIEKVCVAAEVRAPKPGTVSLFPRRPV